MNIAAYCLTLLLIASKASSCGAQGTDSCYVCLTRAEAIAAADSALKGMAAVKMLPEQKRMVVDLAIAARAMEGAYHGCDSTRSILVKDAATVMAENEENKRAKEFWKGEAKREKRHPVKLVGWAAIVVVAIKGGVELYKAVTP